MDYFGGVFSWVMAEQLRKDSTRKQSDSEVDAVS